MSRPFKEKFIQKDPKATYYKPPGVPIRDLEEVVLTKEEFESMRLKDFEKKNQTEGAKEMGIHQSTFQRLLTRAREKLIFAITNGCAIKIEGGNFKKINPNKKNN